MRVTSPRAWVGLAAALAVVLGVVLYGFFGTATTLVNGQGLFLPPGGLVQVQAPVAGSITEVLVEEGESLGRGEPIVRVAPAGGGDVITVTADQRALVAELLVDLGTVVVPGQELITVEPLSEDGAQQQTAVLFFSAGEGKAIAPGMEVLISPSTAPSEQYGQIVGEVKTVSDFPASPERVNFVVQNESLAAVLGAGAVLEVTVELKTDSGTPSGLRWTAGEGPPFEISHGTIAGASVLLDEQAPASQLFGDE